MAVSDDLEWPLTPKAPQFLHFSLFMSTQWVNIETSYLVYRLTVASASRWTTNHPWKGRGYVTWHVLNFWCPIHISGMAEPRALKFFLQRRPYQAFPKGWQLTSKRDVVLLTWPIFSAQLWTWKHFFFPLGELLSTNALTTDFADCTYGAWGHACYGLCVNSIGSFCHRVCCKLACLCNVM